MTNTINQANSEVWHQERHVRISASIVYQCRNNLNSAYKRLYNLSADLSTIPAITWGLENESVAIKEYEENFGQVEKCGLFISKKSPMFCASPDGITQNNKIIEVKCPYSIRDHHPFEIETLSTERRQKLFYKKENGQLILKKTAYYHQVQFQMFVTGYKTCIFII